ncbi:TPA: hypothetical protein ACTZ5N_004925, partial [Bacillus cereus]
CTSAIPEMDFAFGSKNPTDVSQLAPLGVGVSITSKMASILEQKNHFFNNFSTRRKELPQVSFTNL